MTIIEFKLFIKKDNCNKCLVRTPEVMTVFLWDNNYYWPVKRIVAVTGLKEDITFEWLVCSTEIITG